MSECLMASAFFPLRMKIASDERQKRLLELLKSQEHFNWDVFPLTSVSMKDSAFVTTKGAYQGNASWSGNVWTLINEMVVRGLCDCGEKEAAAELALKTIRAFSHNCTEFINPFDGSGHGVLQYAWTASQYLELIIETIFGIRYRSNEKVITVAPNITKDLMREQMALRNIVISDGVYLDIIVDHGNVICRSSSDSIRIKIEK